MKLKSMDQGKKKYNGLLVVALLLLFTISQYQIFVVERQAWFDVSFSLQTSYLLNRDGFSSIDFQQYDVSPGNFYYLLAGWQKLNPGGIFKEYSWGQEMSVFFLLLFMIFAFKGLVILFGKEGAWAALLLSTLTTYSHYATEVRSYSVVFFLSAVIFYSVVRDFEGKSKIFGLASLFLLPLVHYLSAMAIPFYAIFHWVINKESSNRKKMFWIILLVGILGALISLFWAIPQKMRTAGTWFQPSSVSSFPSALFYSFFVAENWLDYTFASVILYYGFVMVLIALSVYSVYYIFNNKKIDKQERALYVMGLTALFPFTALVFLQIGYVLSGGNQFFALYHHRFFLVITWLFASMMLILFQRFIKDFKQLSSKVVAVMILIGIIIFMQFQYAETAHQELKDIIDVTPCSKEDYIMIGHESPFSSLPYEVYGRQYGCNWKNFISTNITEKMSHSSGFDALDDQVVFWNLTLPPYGFYYVQSVAKEFPLDNQNREYRIIAEGPGIWLVYVESLEKIKVEVNFSKLPRIKIRGFQLCSVAGHH